jgi:lipopolysaccharide/colanic/teichoic acid biosynthesis glycosyltransferase
MPLATQAGTALVLKRALDFVAASFGLLLLSPVLLVITIIVRVTMGKPVIFSQVRPGLHGAPFRLYKFRTMNSACDSQGRLLPDDQRLTRFGSFLRTTSLDELPQLWNVLRGELSLVGPRPLLMVYLERYSPEQARRHDVLPGITGWCQVNGRNNLRWEDKFALDTWYVENWSLFLDLKILLLTARSVVRRDGISREGHVTMPEFMGSHGLAENALARSAGSAPVPHLNETH